MKKAISLALSIILIVSAFAGCSARSSSAGYGGDYSRNTAASAAAPQASAMDNGKTIAMGFGAQTAGEAALAQELVMTDEVQMVSEADAPSPESGIAGPEAKPVMDSRKIIKNVTMQLQTLTFDTSVEDIPKIAENFGGYIQDSYVEGRDMYNERGARSANFTIRIPAENLDSFVNSMGSEFHVISKSQNSQDITENYYDSKARLDALKVQEERLMEMLKQAAELEYLLQVEKELMNVRYEIESLTSALNRMDSYVSMSTVTVYLTEVVKYVPVDNVPVTFGERISHAFQESWESFGEFSQDFAIWFVAAFPFLLMLAVIALVIIFIVRRNVNRVKMKKTKSLNPSAEAESESPDSTPEDKSSSEEEKN